MQISKIKIYPLTLPFLIGFSHSLRNRFSTNNIFVEIIAEKGEIKGYGEGAPRSYVTGESQKSIIQAIHNFSQQNNFPWELNDTAQLYDYIDSISNGKKDNAAICALETAFLDALGKKQNRNIIDFFPKDFFTTRIYYGAVIPMGQKKQIKDICRLVKKMRVKKLKLKMGKNYDQNKEIVETVARVFENDYDMKVDVNGVWDVKLAKKHMDLLTRFHVKVLEQPMMPGDPHIADLANMLEKTGIILMADESACSLKNAEKIVEEDCYKMVNIRLSKCGGFGNSLKMIDYLRRNRILFQIGCHLGESGILSAAGRVLSLLCSDAVYYDGSYDEYLLKENVTSQNVSFGPRGKAGPIEGHGIGVGVDIRKLNRLSNGSGPVTITRP